MAPINAQKNAFSQVLGFFSDNVKDNLLKIIIIFAVYWVVNSALQYFILFANAFFYKFFYFLLQLSFVSAVLPLLSGKRFKVKSVFPGIMFIVFSFVLWASVFLFSLPVRMIIEAIINVFFKEFLGLPSFVIFVLEIFYNFIIALFIIFMLFSVFDYLKKPALDLPLLNAGKILNKNKSFIVIIALILTLLYFCVPFLKDDAFSFIFRMIFGIFLMTVYLALKSASADISGISESEPSPPPKMNI